jgi:hypothetical protein
MENAVLTSDQLRLNLLERCFNLGLPASSKDDIGTLKMYLDVDSKLELDDFEFQFENPIKPHKEVKSFINKLFSI